MKKVLKVLFILVSVLLTKLVLSFSINEIIIWNYNNNIYNSTIVKSLYFLNFNQPYIAYYNEGNILYKKENYNEAINKYTKALSKNPPQNKVCDIRINLSLAMIKNINSKEYEEVYNKLEEAKNNLYNNDCASPTDNSGYSQEAEKLEEEIKKLQKQLNNTSGDGDSDDSQDEEEQDSNEDYSDIEEKLKEIEKDANANRQSDLSIYENMGDYSYYDGKRW